VCSWQSPPTLYKRKPFLFLFKIAHNFGIRRSQVPKLSARTPVELARIEDCLCRFCVSRKPGERSNFDQTGKAVNIYPVLERAFPLQRMQMRKQYQCEGVVSGALAVRESEISKETGIRELGGTCLACGNRQSRAGQASFARQCPPG
jgi:hypothetical protein